ncbi:MAG: ABC transporter ATP-binding protein [Clostridiales Family XIII bacterium]|jgi:branched-chain amino acid transport system ATP-binding protein|nr:ABC transporter ATP-binding protein [Clostridiales Family XIII bacterium]
MEKIFEAAGICACYGRVQVLWDVSLSIDKAQIVALLGANGAGKSTLLNAMAGLHRPTAGEVRFLSERIDTLASDQIIERGIAYLPEGGRLFPDMTIRENLEMGAYTKALWGRRTEALKRVYAMFPILEERHGQLARTMSGGERQMLAMGRCLMADPKLIFFDELSYGLSPLMAQEVFRIVRQLRDEGITVLLVEQNVHQTLEIADYAYVLENGRIVLEGEAHGLLNDDYVKQAYLGI